MQDTVAALMAQEDARHWKRVFWSARVFNDLRQRPKLVEIWHLLTRHLPVNIQEV